MADQPEPAGAQSGDHQQYPPPSTTLAIKSPGFNLGEVWLPGLILSLIFLLPLVGVVLGSVLAEGWAGWLDRSLELIRRGSTWRSLSFSLVQASISAIITLVLAMPGAYCLVKYRFFGRRIIQALGMASFVLPSLLIILGVISFYGRAGVLNSLLGTQWSFVYSPVGIILAHVLFNLAIGIRLLARGWEELDPRYIEASRSLGDSSFGRLVRLYLPFLTRRIISAFLIIFLYCFLSFSIILLFGGVGFITLEVLIYREMYVNLNPAGAGFLVLLQLAVVGGVVGLIQYAGKNRDTRLSARAWNPTPLSTLPLGPKILWRIYWLVIGMIVIAPLVALVWRSFTPQGTWTLSGYIQLFTGQASRGTGPSLNRVIRGTVGQAVRQSLVFAGATGAITSILGYLVAKKFAWTHRPWIDALFLLPLLVSGVTLSLGYTLIFDGWVVRELLIVLVQVSLAFPLVFRFYREAFRSFPKSYGEASQSLGANRWFEFSQVEFPLLRGPMIQAFAFGAAISLGDFTGAYTLGRGEVITIPVALFRLIGFQHFGSALSLGVVYLLMTLALFLILEIDRKPQ